MIKNIISALSPNHELAAEREAKKAQLEAEAASQRLADANQRRDQQRRIRSKIRDEISGLALSEEAASAYVEGFDKMMLESRTELVNAIIDGGKQSSASIHFEPIIAGQCQHQATAKIRYEATKQALAEIRQRIHALEAEAEAIK